MTSFLRPRAERRPAARRDDRREPAPHRRARSATARRWSSATRTTARPTASSGTQVDRAARGPARPRRRRRATASASGRRTATSGSSSQYATARVGAILVNINPAYKAAELEYALQPVRRQPAAPGPRLPADRLRRRCWPRSGRAARRCATRSCSTTTGTRCSPRATRVADAELAEREATLQFDDPINIQYTSGTTGLPEGRDAHAPQHPEQRLLHRRARCGYTERDRVCVPVPFYHCFGMVLGNLACTTPRRVHGRPGRGVRPAGRAGDGPGRALHVALRRADDVHRRARAPAASTSSTCRQPADRRSWPARRARSS